MKGPGRLPEHVRGGDRVPWFLGFLLIVVIAGLASVTGLDYLYSVFGSPGNFRLELLIANLVEIPSMCLAMALWVLFVTMPAPAFDLYPNGVVLDHGLRSEFFPWDRVGLVGTNLITVSRKLKIRSAFSLDPFQLARVGAFVPREKVRPTRA